MDRKRILPGNYHYKRYTLEHFFDDCQRLGFENIELWASGPHFHLDYCSQQDLVDLRRVLKDRGLSVKCLTPEQAVYPISVCHPDEHYRRESIDFFKRHLEISSFLGCDTMLVSPGVSYLDVAEERQWDWVTAAFKELTEAAEREGVTLVFEPFTKYSTFINDSASVKRLLSAVDSPHLQVVFDSDVVASTDKEKPETFIQTVGEDIGHVHFVDGNPGGHLIPGTGKLDLNLYFKMLKDLGYTGYYGLEFFDRNYYFNPAEALEKTALWFENH
jgi:protein FrlC